MLSRVCVCAVRQRGSAEPEGGRPSPCKTEVPSRRRRSLGLCYAYGCVMTSTQALRHLDLPMGKEGGAPDSDSYGGGVRI